ncbi:MAG: GNAT family N-acetyltransferase [Hyphomicrobiaceae bacterium]
MTRTAQAPIRPFSEADRAALVALLRDYEKGIGISLDFQSFGAELAALPGAYVPPDGALLIARSEADDLVGTVALRGLDRAEGICEMKRLYVAPAGRGQGLGRRLAEAAIAEARSLGYRAMRLDTLPSMQDAQRLYEILGFREIAKYNGNPIDGTRFLEKDLTAP